ncbi:MAG: rRNA maturation RNase YbeY [Granulosicoccus sp.]|nr:rRNA maturation RNase YbeY [Granulosicoccus sp.]
MHTLEILLDEEAISRFDVQGVDLPYMHVHCSAALNTQSVLDVPSVSTVQMSISWQSESEMRSLNLRFRGQDSATNVLSFESALPSLDSSDGQSLLALGDIVLCPPLIEREASEQQKALRDHWAHLLVHGTLHLCGYDHQSDNEALQMERLETEILRSFAINDPYHGRTRR